MSRADTLYPANPDELKTVKQVAEATGRTEGAILRFIQRGILPAVDQPSPRGGRPLKMVRAGDIFLIAFRPRWEHRAKPMRSKTGALLHPTTLPE